MLFFMKVKSHLMSQEVKVRKSQEVKVGLNYIGAFQSIPSYPCKAGQSAIQNVQNLHAQFLLILIGKESLSLLTFWVFFRKFPPSAGFTNILQIM